ncbi:aspartate kinase [Halalkalibacterium halodurans]|uniref:Aspartokinase n=1 Tax=Halalkalibacterium halodurans (strain ATCC BAA-125 / DSM 18197 / FERM 7344 / JCM 9153 / C-125) TaxID=272558 RepID=Q9KA90_HALH5|nr:aspartate kinase [Halalkalibacterium halodurans]MDY7222948.1 aspartate kinase [Halalkalibacterium halodurans]MDY7242169.1 aspartate kinase [Halalkalibacterium halodurans]MED4080065.1 aspartate kinase [Halalkalibacterium halodurans]MED4086832.1 aspartate kinase [Halalkalibacterium halodurans]MED4104256.1 aspartate kinase [Halalkalibacterium halodurans]
MKIIIQKFGGTSVKTAEVREMAAKHVEKAVEGGYKVVVVVSAMGRSGDPYATDTLLQLVDTKTIAKREQDLLVSCGEIISSVVFTELLLKKGIQATAMTGAQAGFRTNEEFTNAKIVDMKVDRLKKTLVHQDVVVVAGFQGQSPTGETTTLGRGGSDTSATALGAALDAEWVDIFTDVEGIMTADPRIVSEARPLDTMTYNEVCNMAYQGAKVIHPRAVEIAMQAKIPIHIRSTYSDGKGTLVTSMLTEAGARDVQDRIITGIAHMSGVTQIKVHAKDGEFDLQEKVFRAMAAEKISVDFININLTGVVYTVMDEVADRAIEVLRELGFDPEVKRHCAKVSAVGAGMTGVPGVTAKIVAALSQENIRILQSADSHTTIWVLVSEDDLTKAVNALHRMFHLEQSEQTKQKQV